MSASATAPSGGEGWVFYFVEDGIATSVDLGYTLEKLEGRQAGVDGDLVTRTGP